MLDVSTTDQSHLFKNFDSSNMNYHHSYIQEGIEQIIEESMNRTLTRQESDKTISIKPDFNFSDIEDFVKLHNLDKIDDPDFLLKEIESKHINPFGHTSIRSDNIEQDTFWEPFKASDSILNEVIASTIESSDDLLSLIDNPSSCNIHSSPGGICLNRALSSDWLPIAIPHTPLRLSGINNQNSRHTISSPAGVGTVSFAIKAGRIIPTLDKILENNSRSSNDSNTIFKTPSSKRKLDFYSGTPDTKDQSNRKPSRLIIGSVEEGILAVPSEKENVFPSLLKGTQPLLPFTSPKPFIFTIDSKSKPKTLSSLSSISISKPCSDQVSHILSPNSINNISKPLTEHTTINAPYISLYPTQAKISSSPNIKKSSSQVFSGNYYSKPIDSSERMKNQNMRQISDAVEIATAKCNGPQLHSELMSDYSYLSADESSEEDANIKETLMINDDKISDEDEPVNRDYEDFIQNVLNENPTNIPGDEEDPDDTIYELEPETQIQEYINFRKTSKSLLNHNSPRLSYRIKEKELSGLIADCHTIISSDTTNSPFQKIQLSSEIVISSSTNTVITPTKRLALLLQIHVQLLFQQFMLCSSLIGDQDAIYTARSVYFMLSELRLQSDRAWSILGRDLLDPSIQIKEQFSSVFMLPCLERLCVLRPTLDRLGLMSTSSLHASELASSAQSPSLTRENRELPVSINMLFELFTDSFSDKWKPIPFKPDTTERVKFLESEDRLLLRGLYKYGTSNWSQIHNRFIPTKQPKQLATRYKNLISRTAPPNPIKDFYFRQFLPLSTDEKKLFIQGIEKYGMQYSLISEEFLPQRTPSFLRRSWGNELNRLRQK